MIVVTGSSGFLGSHIHRATRDLSKTMDAVVHMAAISDTTCTDEAALYQTNVVQTLQWADYCAKNNLRFIYASSASVYGNGAGPLNAYARSKATVDGIMCAKSGEWYGLRFFNAFGGGEEHKGEQASIITRFRHQSVWPLWGASWISRDFIHVDDIVSVVMWILENGPDGGIYDVGTGQSRMLADVAKACGATVADQIMPSNLSGKYQFHTKADLTKLRAAGYTKPFLTLEEGIARMVGA
jgi:ADP-L-glycero-D-manno-heptose 6-epimerase